MHFLSAPNFLFCELCHLVFVRLPVGKGCLDLFGQIAPSPQKYQLDHHKVDSHPERPTPISCAVSCCLNIQPQDGSWISHLTHNALRDLIPWLVRFVHILQTQQKCAETLNLGRDLFWLWRVGFDPGGKEVLVAKLRNFIRAAPDDVGNSCDIQTYQVRK